MKNEIKEGRGMNEEQLNYYFIQYWFNTNRAILMMDDLKKVLFEVYREVEKLVPLHLEQRIKIIEDLYKQRILKGIKFIEDFMKDYEE